jgi:predicted amidohydrolase YtcJ
VSDLFLHNARIWTGDDARPWADCAIVRDGRFAFVGREGDANVRGGIPRLDAGGRLVVPGFVDAHVHLLGTGAAMRAVDLRHARDEDDAARLVGERVRETPPGTWVHGRGWDQHRWPGVCFPHRRSLDAVAPGHPVVLTHVSGHCDWANSAALRAAGITRETQSPVGGAIERDADGEPTGVLFDEASRLVHAAIPPATHDERVDMLREAVAHAHALGVTGVHAMDVGSGELRAMHALHDERSLSLRTRVYLSSHRLDRWIEQGVRTGDGDDMLRIGGVKYYSDGALGSLTAWMLEPYEGSDNTGLPLHAHGALEAGLRLCLEHGLAPAVHAIGDRANREVLDIFERAGSLAPELPRRVEHAQLLTAEDIPRFGAVGVAASVQPIHATQDMEKVDRGWGERGRHAYAFASLLASGATLAFGSDSPVETLDPLAGLHAAVTRRDARGEPAGGWYPDERLPLEAALRAYGAGPAAVGGEAERAGVIAAGRYADFVVLSDDLFALPDEMWIAGVRPDVTVVAGEAVYRREGAA